MVGDVVDARKDEGSAALDSPLLFDDDTRECLGVLAVEPVAVPARIARRPRITGIGLVRDCKGGALEPVSVRYSGKNV